MLAAVGALVFAGVVIGLGLQNFGGPSWPYTGAQLVSVVDDIGAPAGFQPVFGGPTESDGSDALGEEQAPTASVGYDSPDQAAALDADALDKWVTQRLGALGLQITSASTGGVNAVCGDLEIDVTVEAGFPLSVTATGSAGPPTQPQCPAELSNPPAHGSPEPTLAPNQSNGSSTLLAWGFSEDGALGDHATSDGSTTPLPVSLPDGTTVSAITSGDDFALALTSGGSVLAWGSGGWGQLGDGANTDSDYPVVVHLPSGTVATAIAAGDDFGLALSSDGTIFAWGYNFYGDLGDEGSADTNTPTPVVMPYGVVATAIAAGGDHALALTNRSGCVLGWGDNKSGEVGNGTFGDDLNPPEVTTPGFTCLPEGTDVTAVAAGGDFSLALTSEGGVYSWGNNAYGQLGQGGSGGEDSTPALVGLDPATAVMALAAGRDHALALTSTGVLLAWGDDEFGQLGNGTTTGGALPVAVSLTAGAKATEIAAGQTSSLAVTAGGTVLTWGDLINLGIETSGSDLPRTLMTPNGVRLTLVAGGGQFSIAAS
jgi:alpha-tubulin suppressor-like RCC1 family protein